MSGITRARAKEIGFTHLATHRKDSKYRKKGDTVFVTYKNGEYSTGPMVCLLNPEDNYDIEEL